MFQFNSGDVLVFDQSSEAAIVHGVKSINEHESGADFCMMNGNDCMPTDFGRYRFGVQCRVKLETPTTHVQLDRGEHIAKRAICSK